MRLRNILIGIVVVAVGLLATGYAILKSLDLNDYKDEIAAKVKEATGRDLTLAGNIELEISFTPRLAVNDVTFANAEWGSRPEMAKIERLEAVVDLMPLLSSEIRINRIVLIGADVLLETDANGRGNWGLLSAGGGDDSSASASGSGNVAIAVDEITIERALIAYLDGATGESHSVAIDTLSAAADSASAPVAVALVGSLNGAPISVDGTVPSLDALQSGGDMPIDLTIGAGGATVTAKGIVSQDVFDLALTANGERLSDLGALAGAVLPAIGPYSLSTQMTNPDGTYRLGGLDIKMAGSTLTGDASVALNGPRPRIVADLQSTLLDLEDFGIEPAEEADGGTPPANNDGRVFPDEPLPFDGLRAIDATVRFAGAQIVKAPNTLENLSLDIVLENGRLTMKNIGFDLAGGQVAIGGVIDSSQNPAGVSLQIVSNQVEAGALLQTFGGSDVLTGGKVDMSVDVAGSGNSVRQIMASLGGATNFEMGPGQINDGFARIVLSDLFELIASGGSDGSNLNCVVSRFSIVGGVAESTALVLDTKGATIIGNGEIDLRSEEPDLRLVPNAKQTNLANLAIPIRIRGTLADPSVGPDAEAMAQGLVGSVTGVSGSVFDVLSGGGSAAGETTGGTASGNDCVAALDQSGITASPTPSAGEMITEGAEQMLDGAGQAGEGIGQGAEEVFDDAGEALKGLFGN
jgi:uncharacterized protein involved in outer membrane biogenesis